MWYGLEPIVTLTGLMLPVCLLTRWITPRTFAAAATTTTHLLVSQTRILKLRADLLIARGQWQAQVLHSNHKEFQATFKQQRVSQVLFHTRKQFSGSELYLLLSSSPQGYRFFLIHQKNYQWKVEEKRIEANRAVLKQRDYSYLYTVNVSQETINS